MAGNSGNWFKTGKGSAKGNVFVSNATILATIPMLPGENLASIKAGLHGIAQSSPDTIGALAAMSPQPAGQAMASNDARSAPGDIATASDDAIPAEFAKYPRIYEWARDHNAEAEKFANLQARFDAERPFDDDMEDSELNRTMEAAFQAANPKFKPSPKQAAAIGKYQGSGYQRINAILWNGMITAGGGLDPQKTRQAVLQDIRNLAKTNVNVKKATDVEAEYQRLIPLFYDKILQDWEQANRDIRTLDSTLEMMGAPFSFTATRSQGRSHPLFAAMAGMNIGDTFTSAGFESASIDPGNSWENGDVLVDYQIPPGAPGAYLNGIKGFGSIVSHEMEWLVPAGSKWTVADKVTGADGRMRVTLGLVGITDPFTGESRW